MRIKIIYSFLFITLFSVIFSFGQAGEQSGMIKSAKGVFVVWNQPGNYYTVEIIGKTIVPASQPLLFQVDGKFFQIQTVEKKVFLKDSSEKNLNDKAVLAAHRDWEGDYISKVIKKTLKIDSEWLTLSNNTDALSWSYNMPRVTDNQSAKRQLYLAVIKKDHVFLLNGATTGDDDEKVLRQLLLETMNTLKPTDKPLSLEKAKQQILKGN